jgi:hypothetical protein
MSCVFRAPDLHLAVRNQLAVESNNDDDFSVSNPASDTSRLHYLQNLQTE